LNSGSAIELKLGWTTFLGQVRTSRKKIDAQNHLWQKIFTRARMFRLSSRRRGFTAYLDKNAERSQSKSSRPQPSKKTLEVFEIPPLFTIASDKKFAASDSL